MAGLFVLLVFLGGRGAFAFAQPAVRSGRDAIPSGTPFYLPYLARQNTPTPPASSVLRVLGSDSSHLDGYGNRHVVGEVENLTPENLQAVGVTARFQDGQGNELASISGSAYLKPLPGYDKTCFDISAGDPAGWSTYELQPSSYLAGNEPPAVLTVAVLQAYYDAAAGRYVIVGSVTNGGTPAITEIKVVAALYDAGGNVLDCGLDAYSISYLEPGHSGSFMMLLANRNPPSDYAAVASYRLQAGGVIQVKQ